MNSSIKVYLVGGAVRDKLLGKDVHDADYVVVGSTPEHMLSQGFFQVGADFPVFLHPTTQQEYALARTERKSGNAHTDFVVQATPDVTLEDDLIRRDLTINAMAIEVNGLFDSNEKTGEIIDFYSGLSDLENGILRHVSVAFCEDPLRVLRVARFYARYYNSYYHNADNTFVIADETLQLMQKMVQNGDLLHLSRERIWTESQKATMSYFPHVYWQTLDTIGALHLFSPLEQAWQDDVTKQTISEALSLSVSFNMSIEQRWAILMASFAQNDWIKDIERLAKTNCIPKKVIDLSKLYAQYAHDLDTMYHKPIDTKQLLTVLQGIKAHKEPYHIDIILFIHHTINMARSQVLLSNALQSYQAIGINDIDKNLQGKAIGEALEQARIEHLRNNITIGLS